MERASPERRPPDPRIINQAAGSKFRPAGRCRQGNPAQNDNTVEASQAINGPAGNPECVWLGRRVVG
jgi:hypothetical protein